MNVFEIYGLIGRVFEAPNWQEIGPNEYRRSDGARATTDPNLPGWRVSYPESVDVFAEVPLRTRIVGGILDIEALRYIDRTWPCAPPMFAVGQVWSAGGYEFLIVSLKRLADGMCEPYVMISDSLQLIQADVLFSQPCALLHGPNAPWVSPNWQYIP